MMPGAIIIGALLSGNVTFNNSMTSGCIQPSALQPVTQYAGTLKSNGQSTAYTECDGILVFVLQPRIASFTSTRFSVINGYMRTTESFICYNRKRYK